MLKINILTVGKLKEKYWQDAINEYSKRLSRYAKVKIVEVADEKTDERASENQNNKVKEKEGQRLLSNISDGDYVIALAIDGKMYDSVGFAQRIEQIAVGSIDTIDFVIGGSLGLSSEILNRANEKISFGKMTYPHQMMRVILFEQIYRAYRIINNEPYHK